MKNRTFRRAGIAALTSGAALIAWSRLLVDRRVELPPALPGRREDLETRCAGRVSLYGPQGDGDGATGRPLLLVHSVNAAASAYEVRPLYLHYRASRPVYALDLPGFGFSERSRRRYTPRLMVEGIHAVADQIHARHGGAGIDAVALSLSAAYLARAALERPDDYRSLGLISPIGFDGRMSGHGPPDGHRGRDLVRAVLDRPPLGRALFDALVCRPSVRFFLKKTFGSPVIDEGLLAYDYATAHQPGAEHAPYCFIAGHLFPTDVTALYEALRLPVWMVHGTRGDFTDYRLAPRFAGLLNWRMLTLPTGAFPHFERLSELAAAYDAFLSDP